MATASPTIDRTRVEEPIQLEKITGPFEIVKPVRVDRYLNLCIYGDYGVGKTHLASTADDVKSMKDVLYIDAESGDLTLQHRPDLDVIRVNQYSQLARIYEFLRLHCKYREAGDDEKIMELQQKVMSSPKLRHYHTVVIDSLSEVFKYSMYQLTGVQLGKQALDVEPEPPGFGEWGKTTEMIRLLVRSLRDLPIHVIIVCSEKINEDKSKRSQIGLNLSKGLAVELPGFLDIVGYLAVASVGGEKNNPTIERRLYLQAGHGFLAKCRFPTSASYIEDPTIGKLLQEMQGVKK